VEEWGQVVIVNMLSRYARTQFTDPNLGDELDELTEKSFYENSDDSDDSDDEEEKAKKKKAQKPKMDPDHRLLLRSAKPLLQSRNASVVMATAQLYHHCAPKAEVQVVAKAMIRLLRAHREVQAIVLNSIASMTSSRGRHNMFEPYLRNFFVRSSDPTHIKILKLEIITNMASESNIGLILREFQSYITGQDKVCIAATIQAIGRCAASIEGVTDTCLNGLVHLLSNGDEAVVAESVVVIKKLLQTQAGDHSEIIEHMSRLVDTISVPAARAAILWVMGEYAERVPKIAPDVLRKVAKTFTEEEPEVKMQTLNLAAKLCLINPEQTKLLSQYVFNLARYDQSYDIRDRARFMRCFVFPPPGHENNKIIQHAKKIFLVTKPAPVIESRFKDREVFQLGSLSHFLNSRATGYQDLPNYPEEAPDASVRNVEPPKVTNPWSKSSSLLERKLKSGEFFGQTGNESSSGTSDSDSSSSSSSSSSGSMSDDEASELDKERIRKHVLHTNGKVASPRKAARASGSSSSSGSSGSDDSSGSSSSDDSDEKQAQRHKPKAKPKAAAPKPKQPQTNLDLLLDLSNDGPNVDSSVMTPSMGTGMLSPSDARATSPDTAAGGVTEASAAFIQTKSSVLLSKMMSGGVQIMYRYTRSPHLYSSAMTNIELSLTNLTDNELTDVKIGAKNLAPGMSLHEFPGIATVPVGSTVNANVGINFGDTTQAAKFDLVASGRCHSVSKEL
jgi:AP-3 complex subunit beta